MISTINTRYIVFFIFIVLSNSSNCQENKLPDLIDNSFNSFHYENEASVWISSQGGWNKNDAKGTHHYLCNDSLSGLKGEWIQSTFYPDNEGTLWTCTHENLCSFNTDQNKFNCFHPSNGQDTFQIGIKIIDYNSNTNELLIRAGHNLHYYDIDHRKLKSILPSKITRGQNFTHYKENENTNYIASTWTSSLEFYTQNQNQWQVSNVDFSQCKELSKVSISHTTVFKNNIWLCSNIGLIKYNRLDPCDSQLFKYKNAEFITTNSLVFEDFLLITTDNYGLLAFNLEEESFTNLLSINDHSYPLLSNRPVEIFDSEHDIIVSHRSLGVQFIPKSIIRARLIFERLSDIKVKKLSTNHSILAFTNRENKILIYRDNERYDELEVKVEGILNHFSLDMDFLYFADDYSIWKYDLSNKNVALLFSDKSIKIDKIFIYNNEVSVIGNTKAFDLKDKRLILKPKINPNQNIVSYDKLDYELDLVTRTNLVEVYQNEQQHKIETGSYIYSIVHNSLQNRILLGLGKGIGVINLNTNEFTIRDIQGARIGDIQYLNQNDYLVNSSKGLFYFVDDQLFKRINNGEEVLDFDISDNYIHFIDKNGLNTIPTNELSVRKKPTIYIESATYEQSANEKQIEFKYSYRDMPMSLDILSKNWKSNEIGYYTYQINGIHNQPIQQKFGKSIDLPGLVEGNYEIEIYGYSSDLTPSDPLSVIVVISGPFWRQWWFYLASMIIVLLGAYLYFRYNNNKLLEQHKIQKDISDLERSALQAQMNPHFIFNCLNSIQGFIMDNDKEQAMEYLGGFAQLIRSNLNASIASKISLAEEHRILHNYLKLERLRLNNSFEFEITLPDHKDAYDIMIPPMLIQPFVENAVIHGMRNGIKNGLIEIKFNLDGSTLNVEVADNGDSSLPPINIPGHKSVGVDITRKRLDYINQSDKNIDNLSINHTSSGTIVNLSIQLD